MLRFAFYPRPPGGGRLLVITHLKWVVGISIHALRVEGDLNISDLQMSYITNVEAGHGLIKVGSSLVPFANKFPKNTKLYKLMTTKPGEA